MQLVIERGHQFVQRGVVSCLQPFKQLPDARNHRNQGNLSTMNDEIRGLFQELADLSPPDRERIFGERRTEPTIRAEVESLLAFDNTEDRSLTGVVGSTAQNMLDNGP